MNKLTPLHERIAMMEMVQAGYNDQQIADHLHWSVSPVRKWRRRAQTGGRAALSSPMGRPRRGVLSSYPQRLRDQLRHWRSAHPGWGPKTLQAELRCHPAWQTPPLPSLASIARFLKDQGLSRPYERHSALPPAPQAIATREHQIWQMDARSYQRIANVGYISLINLNDRASHVRLLSYPCPVGQTRWQRPPDSRRTPTVSESRMLPDNRLARLPFRASRFRN